MQVKANRVIVANHDGSVSEFENVEVIQGGNGLYVDHKVVIGTDPEGKDISQQRLSLYPWEKISLLEWNEPTLIEQVKEFVILTELEDFADLLEEIQEEMEEQEQAPAPAKEATGGSEDNPYN
tara:strand:- start:13558 stop:13926 length:369 start_codon:yes stop_codon:yes gene_type:complete